MIQILDELHQFNLVDIQWKIAMSLGKCTACFQRALEETWNSHIRIYWVLHVSDWVDSLIGPGGLLLVVCCWIAVLRAFHRLGLEKSKGIKTWIDVTNVFAGSHTQHRWRCSYVHVMMEPVCTFSFAPFWILLPSPKTKKLALFLVANKENTKSS